MALKNWKKVEKDCWKSTDVKFDVFIKIVYSEANADWRVLAYSFYKEPMESLLIYGNDTHKIAVESAMDYMRTHDGFDFK
jgi:hypothetical protein